MCSEETGNDLKQLPEGLSDIEKRRWRHMESTANPGGGHPAWVTHENATSRYRSASGALKRGGTVHKLSLQSTLSNGRVLHFVVAWRAAHHPLECLSESAFGFITE